MKLEINNALSTIPSNLPRTEWVKIAFSAKANNISFDDFHNWSKSASNYKSEKDCLTVWNSDNKSGINAAYLYKVAQDHGFINKGDGTAKNQFFDNPTDWFNSLSPLNSHQYIDDQDLQTAITEYLPTLRTGTDKNGCFIADPLYNINTKKLTGFNRIYGTGKDNKRLAPKTVKSGNAGCVGTVKDGQEIGITEGMADAVHIHNDKKIAVFIASDAGNLKHIVNAVRSKYPNNPITVFADSDNVGINAAIDAKPNNISISALHKDYTDAHKQGNKQQFIITAKTHDDAHKQVCNSLIEAIRNAVGIDDAAINIWIKRAAVLNIQNLTATFPTLIKVIQDKTDLVKPEIKTAVKKATQHLQTEALKQRLQSHGIDDALVTIKDSGERGLIEHSKAAKTLATLSDLINNLKFNDITDAWMQYENNNWENSTDAKTDRHIKDSIEQQAGDVGFNIQYLKGVKDFVRTEVIASEWNNHKHLISMKNGILNTETMQLIAHDKKYRITTQLPYDYDPSAKCPVTQKFLLDTVGGDEGQQQILRGFMNAIIKGRADMQRCLVLVGQGGSGKGTFFRLCSSLVGTQNILSTNFKRIEGNTGRFETGKAYLKKLITIPDAEQYTGSVETMKSIIGQDSIPYEEKNKNNAHNGNFIYDGMVIIASNEPLAVNDNTSGWKRRNLNLNFNNSRNTRDGKLTDKLNSELSGVFNWVLSMSDDDVTAYVKNTNETVQSANALAFEALIEGNALAAWVDDNIVLDSDAKTQIGIKKELLKEDDDGNKIKEYENHKTRLYPNYLMWCVGIGKKAISGQRFSKLLAGLFTSPDLLNMPSIQKARTGKHGTHFTGITIREAADNDTPSPLKISALNSNKNNQKKDGDNQEEGFI